jgi:hypothetical protein
VHPIVGTFKRCDAFEPRVYRVAFDVALQCGDCGHLSKPGEPPHACVAPPKEK